MEGTGMSLASDGQKNSETLPQISLIEEFLLLTLEDSGGEFDSVPEIYLSCGIAGAALMDLALRDRINSDLDAVFLVNPTPTGDPTLDRALAELAAEPRRLSAQEWIARLSRQSPRLAQGGALGAVRAGHFAPERLIHPH